MNKITFPLKLNMQGAAVADLQETLRLCLDRSAILANDEGARRQLSTALKPERDGQTYGGVTGKLVKIFQGERNLQPSGEVDEPTANALNALLQEWGLLDQPPGPAPPPSFVVSGQVRLAEGKPLAGFTVIAVDKDLRAEESLGKTTTDANGHYEMQYNPDQFARAEKDTADLIVRVFNAAGSVIAESPALFNAPREATVDIVVAGAAPGVLSEYERLLSELTPLLVNVLPQGTAPPTVIDQLADLKSEDLDFLTGEAGEERAKLEFIVAAARLEKQALAQDFVVSAEAFYGLAREGLPIDLVALLTHTAQEMRNALTQAIQDNLVPNALSATLDNIIDQLQRLVVHSTLNTVPVAGAHSVGEILTTVLPPAQQATLLSLAANHDGSPEEFWAQVRAHPDFQQPGVVDKLQLTLQLG